MFFFIFLFFVFISSLSVQLFLCSFFLIFLFPFLLIFALSFFSILLIFSCSQGVSSTISFWATRTHSDDSHSKACFMINTKCNDSHDETVRMHTAGHQPKSLCVHSFCGSFSLATYHRTYHRCNKWWTWITLRLQTSDDHKMRDKNHRVTFDLLYRTTNYQWHFLVAFVPGTCLLEITTLPRGYNAHGLVKTCQKIEESPQHAEILFWFRKRTGSKILEPGGQWHFLDVSLQCPQRISGSE